MSSSVAHSPSARPEAWTRAGDPHRPALLLLHGFTGNPSSVRPVAESLLDTDSTLSVPLLPGHGGTWRDLARTSWAEWSAAAVDEFDRLASLHPSVVVAGLTMGGALALDVGAQRTPASIVAINPALFVDSPAAPLLPLLRHVLPTTASIGGDIEKPGAVEDANDRTSVRAAASLHAGLRGLRQRLWRIDAPVTVCVSGRDGVVAPRSLRALRTGLPQPPRIVALRRSRHVATLDYDAPIIEQTIRESLAAAAGGGA